jgi:hypothetical protein
MKTLLLGTCASLLVAGLALSVPAQNRERFGISAKAGGVNAVSGQVTVKREGQEPQLLTSQDNLNSGDMVTSSYGSQAEILLNPGTYLRLAEKSEIVLVDNSLDKLLLKLNRGSAIIEATGPDEVNLRIPIITDQQRLTIVRAGLYRINVAPGTTELLVRKGRVLLGDDPGSIVKGGKKVTITSGTTPMIAKLTRNDKDEFDTWSQDRGRTLASANQRLSTRMLNSYLSATDWGWTSAAFGRWGLWTWSPFSSCYTFLPFFYGWGSPYGAYYGQFAGFGGFYPDGRCCRLHIYRQPTIVRGDWYGGGNNPLPPGTSSGSSSGAGTSGGSVMSVPSSRPGSQAGPRDPDSGSRSINRVRDPN